MDKQEIIAGVSIRAPRSADVPRISRLLRSLSHTYTTSPDGKGAEAFLATLTDSAIAAFLTASDVTYLVAEYDGELAAAAALRGIEKLAHLFVNSTYQGLGLGRKLWELLRDDALRRGNPGVFTVNSSVVAVPVYEKFGFLVAGPKVEKDGGAYVPMTLDIRNRLQLVRPERD